MSDNHILLTRFQGRKNDRLTKRFVIDNDGKIRKESTPNFQKGIAERRHIGSLSEIETLIDDLRFNECIATGIYQEEWVNVLPEAKLDDAALKRGCLSRSKRFLTQPERGLVLLDYDPNPDLPAALQFNEPASLMQALTDAIPELQHVGCAGTASCSAGVHRIGDEVPVNGAVGLHLYLVFEGGDLERLKRVLAVKLWNAGLGFIAYAKNGARLQRTILDLSVLSPERLIFEARPILGEGISQTPRVWTHRKGGVLCVD